MLSALPSYEELKADKRKYARELLHAVPAIPIRFQAKRLAEPYGRKLFVAAEPSGEAVDTDGDGRCLCASLLQEPMHPVYEQTGGIPAIREVKFSSGEQPWLLRRLQLLCADVPSGQNYPDEKP